VSLGLSLKEGDVAHGIGRFVFGEVVRIGRSPAGWFARMGLDQNSGVVEADGLAVGTGAQLLADEASGQRVEGLMGSRRARLVPA
jgi:hypothetical protein